MELQVFNNSDVFGKNFNIYGSMEEPYFLAKDVADWIGINKPAEMVANVDEEEKLMALVSYSGQKRNMWLLNEYGVYEVLSTSRKPLAKKFREQVKAILREIRLTGSYSAKQQALPLTTEEQIALVAKGHVSITKKVDNVEKEVREIKESYPIWPAEAKALKDLVGKRVYEIIRVKFNDNKVQSISSPLFRALYKSLKTAFMVNNYASIRRSDYEEAMRFVGRWEPPSELVFELEKEHEGL